MFCALLVAITSCSPQKRLNRLIKNHPELAKVDSVYVNDTVITKEVFRDTTLYYLQPDTVTITKDKLIIKYFFNPKDSSVYLVGKCKTDTIVKTRLQYIYKVSPTPQLTWWQKVKLWIGEKALWFILFMIILLLWRVFGKVIKGYLGIRG